MNNKNKKQRERNIIWFNPPFNKNVRTNVAKTFLGLVDKHFPKNNKLHKIFNRNTVKVSYSCTENIIQIIKGNNNKLISPKNVEDLPCNCQNECPLNGKCRTQDVVYGCVASTTKEPFKYYIGGAKGEWKKRHRTTEPHLDSRNTKLIHH